MAQLIERGNPITLPATFRDSATNALIDPDEDPQVAILDPSGSQVALDTPTRVSLGRWEYVWNVAIDAELGAWAIRWTAVLNTTGAEDEDGFTVVEAGALSGGGLIAFGDMQARATCAPWATSDDVLVKYPDYAGDLGILDEACAMAGDILFELTGRQWPGRCHDTIRPLAQWRSWSAPRWWPGPSRGSWGYCSCHRGRETGCASLSEIKLPGHPVDPSGITVLLDGDDFTEFALHDKRYLVRTDGHGWPCCQNLELPSTEPGTFQISYPFGADPPQGGKLSAVVYGYQLALSLDQTSASKCALPKRVTTITRQGTTITVLDPMTLIQDGMVGLALVDQWVASVRHGRSRRAATVLVPGRGRSARRIS